MYYIFQVEDESGFGFKCDDIHEITATDVAISDELYQMFFNRQSLGKSFKLKNISGTTFEEIFEEYVPEIVESTFDKIIRLQNRLTETDHMVVECYEHNMLGLEMPYDLAALHAERQAIKNEIEALQQE